MPPETRVSTTCWPIPCREEGELQKDIAYTLNEKNLNGKYVRFHKITTYTDHKLEELWALHSPYEFAKLHKDFLKDLPEFLSAAPAGNSPKRAR